MGEPIGCVLSFGFALASKEGEQRPDNDDQQQAATNIDSDYWGRGKYLIFSSATTKFDFGGGKGGTWIGEGRIGPVGLSVEMDGWMGGICLPTYLPARDKSVGTNRVVIHCPGGGEYRLDQNQNREEADSQRHKGERKR